MTPLFLQYPACSTCQKAKKWLIENNIEYTNRLIVEDNPDRKSTRLNSSHDRQSRMPSSA